jgi:acetoacetyl-CoA reductase
MTTIALVTGGVRGIGAASALALKQAGHRVAVSYAGNHEAAKHFTEQYHIPAFAWDVSDFNACEKAVAEVEAALEGTIDILVNNAGITRDSMMHKMSPDDWQSVIDTNLTGCWNMSRVVINAMRNKKYGRIIHISSINGLAGQLGQTNYSASKAALFGLTKAMALENANKNITVNAVAPGYIATEMLSAIAPDILSAIIAKIPVGRLGTVEEVARCIVFLAAKESGFITGETLSINGGQYMH